MNNSQSQIYLYSIFHNTHCFKAALSKVKYTVNFVCQFSNLNLGSDNHIYKNLTVYGNKLVVNDTFKRTLGMRLSVCAVQENHSERGTVQGLTHSCWQILLE